MSFSISWVYKARDAFSPVAKKIKKAAEKVREAMRKSGLTATKANSQIVASTGKSVAALNALSVQARKTAYQFDHSFWKMSQSSSRLNRSLSMNFQAIADVGRNLQGFGSGATTRLTLPTVAAGGFSLTRSAQYEQFQIGFGALMKDAELGKETFASLLDFAVQTPFDLRKVMGGANILLASGVTETKEGVLDYLATLGDLAALSPTADVEALAINLSQIKGIGKLQMMDYKQFATAGIPIRDAIKEIAATADGMALTDEGFFDAMSQGAITFEIVEKALQHLRSEGEAFHKGMEKQSGTLGGMWSNFVDILNQTAAAFGDVLRDVLGLDKLLPAITDHLQSFRDWLVEIRETGDWKATMMVGLMGIMLLLGPVVGLVGTLVRVFGLLGISLKAVLGFVTGFGGFARLVTMLIPHVRILSLAIAAITAVASWAPLRNLLAALFNWSIRVRDAFNNMIPTLEIPDWLKDFSAHMVRGFKIQGDLIGGALNSTADYLNNSMQPAGVPLAGASGVAPQGEMVVSLRLSDGLKTDNVATDSKNMKLSFNTGANLAGGAT